MRFIYNCYCRPNQAPEPTITTVTGCASASDVLRRDECAHPAPVVVALKFPVLFLSLAFMLAGCVTSTTASLKMIQDRNEVRVVSTKTGLIWGPCMPAPGSVSVAYVFSFVGERSVYSEREFRAFREISSGARFPLTVEKGIVEMDRTGHRIKIDLTIDGKPCELNGQFTYTYEKEPPKKIE